MYDEMWVKVTVIFISDPERPRLNLALNYIVNVINESYESLKGLMLVIHIIVLVTDCD